MSANERARDRSRSRSRKSDRARELCSPKTTFYCSTLQHNRRKGDSSKRPDRCKQEPGASEITYFNRRQWNGSRAERKPKQKINPSASKQHDHVEWQRLLLAAAGGLPRVPAFALHQIRRRVQVRAPANQRRDPGERPRDCLLRQHQGKPLTQPRLITTGRQVSNRFE